MISSTSGCFLAQKQKANFDNYFVYIKSTIIATEIIFFLH